jgi:hypothetical protein
MGLAGNQKIEKESRGRKGEEKEAQDLLGAFGAPTVARRSDGSLDWGIRQLV